MGRRPRRAPARHPHRQPQGGLATDVPNSHEESIEFNRRVARVEAVEGAIAAVKIYGMDLDEEDLPGFFALVRAGLPNP